MIDIDKNIILETWFYHFGVTVKNKNKICFMIFYGKMMINIGFGVISLFLGKATWQPQCPVTGVP